MSVNKLSKFKQKHCQWNKANKLKLKTTMICRAVAVKTQLDISAARLEMNLKWHLNLATAAMRMFVYIVMSVLVNGALCCKGHETFKVIDQTPTGIDFLEYKGFSFIYLFVCLFYLFIWLFIYSFSLFIYLLFIYLVSLFIYLLFIYLVGLFIYSFIY